ncbi:hypothetical protein WJX82_004948 [Trebouxia sp. C0006]
MSVMALNFAYTRHWRLSIWRLPYVFTINVLDGLVAAFLGSGLPIYRIAVLHRIPFIYMLQWIKTWPFIANPADPMLYLLLFSMDLNLIIVQMTILPDNVHLEDNPMPWCMLAGLKYWASEADLLDEQSSDDEDLSDEDVLASGTTRLATSVGPPLLLGLWPLSSHSQGPKGVGISPTVISARRYRSSGLFFIYQQAHAKGVFNQKIARSANPANPRAAAPIPGGAPSPSVAPGGASGGVPASPTSVIGGGVRSPRPVHFTSHPKLRPGSSGPGAAKTSGRPTTTATPEMDIGLSDPSEGLIPAHRAPSSYPLGKAPGVLSQEPGVTAAGQESVTGQSQEAAPQPQPKLEKQGSGLKQGLKKVKNGVKTVTDRVKDRTLRRPNKTPGPVPTPAAPPAQGSTGSELQRGGSLKDKLKKKFSRRTRGQELFV